jgi:hypothetical protein
VRKEAALYAGRSRFREHFFGRSFRSREPDTRLAFFTGGPDSTGSLSVEERLGKQKKKDTLDYICPGRQIGHAVESTTSSITIKLHQPFWNDFNAH